jgi:Uma2 family endonuclease
MATAEFIQAEQRFLLRGVSWEEYVRLRAAPENEHVRMTYNQGALELMSLSKRHEQCANLLGVLIEIWAMELNIDVQSCGSMTFQREDLDRGLEPDKCYYVKNEPLVRGSDTADFTRDPPPDLAVEICITRSAIDKLPMYAAFGVPEVWRYEGRRLHVHLLQPGRDYESRSETVCFPNFPLVEAERLLARIGEESQTALTRYFRDWVREKMAPGRLG